MSFHQETQFDGHTASATATTVTYSKTALQIAVRNFGTVPDEAQVECYFTAVPIVNRTAKPTPPPLEFVFDHPIKIVTALPGVTNQSTMESVEVRAATTTHSSISAEGGMGSKRQEGTALRGWLVRLVADGKVLAVKASSTGYEEIGRDEGKLHALTEIPRPYEAPNRISIGPFNKSLYQH